MLLNYQIKQSIKHELASKNEIIFVIHGLFGSLSNLSGLAKELCEDFDIILVDVRNHGRSPRNNSMNYQEMAADIFNLADQLGIDNFCVLGHSMGGKIAMACALTQPQRIKQLVVADIAPSHYPDKHSDVFMGLKQVQQLQATNRSEADKILAGYVETPEVRQFLLKSYQRGEDGFEFIYDVEQLHNNYHLIRGWPELDETYTGPTLFIDGEKSDYINEHNRDSISQHFPFAEINTIKDTGHWLHAEKPKQFNAVVKSFFC